MLQCHNAAMPDCYNAIMLQCLNASLPIVTKKSAYRRTFDKHSEGGFEHLEGER